MNWKLWLRGWWRPLPPDTGEGAGENGVNHQDAKDALDRARAAQERTERQNLELRELARRAARQREENHFGSDLYQVMRDRRHRES